jgi:hypothetical protein
MMSLSVIRSALDFDSSCIFDGLLKGGYQRIANLATIPRNTVIDHRSHQIDVGFHKFHLIFPTATSPRVISFNDFPKIEING